MSWIAWRTVLAKEFAASRAIAILWGVQTAVPTDIRSYAPSQRTKRRICREIPLLPKIVLSIAPPDLDNMENPSRYITGPVRNAQGGIIIIPGHQMQVFLEAHQEWLQSQLKAHRAGQQNKNRKAKWRPLEALKEFFADGLDIQNETL